MTAPVRRLAWATFEPLSVREAIVAITYVGSDLFSVFRVEIGRNAPSARLYERAYALAASAADVHGYELDRFSRITA